MKLTSLNTFCSPVNGAQLCWDYSVARIYKIHGIYKNTLRLLFQQSKRCNPFNVFVENCILNCKAVITNIVYKLMLNLDFSCKNSVNAITRNNLNWFSMIQRY